MTRAGRGAALAVAVAALAGVGCTRDEASGSSGPVSAPATMPSAGIATSTSADATNGTSPAPQPTSVATPPASATTPPATASPTASRATPATTVPLDAAVMLAAALDALAPGYHFVTTASVGGQVAVTAEGDHIAGSTQMTVTSGGTSTEYLVTADAAWALADGTWQQLDSTEGLSDPVGQLRSPLSAAATGTAEAATITAEYPNVALGLPGEGQAAVEFQLSAGQITTVRYVSLAQVTGADGGVVDQPAEVTALITPVAPGTQLTLPAAEA